MESSDYRAYGIEILNKMPNTKCQIPNSKYQISKTKIQIPISPERNTYVITPNNYWDLMLLPATDN
ncbi:MAG: hypothetical protein AAF688_02625 [Bacteroidota bacterium]